MAFTATRDHNMDSVFGNKAVTGGTYVSDGGSTGGAINTGLAQVDFIVLTPIDTTVESNAPVVNETITARPWAGNSITIVTDANESGLWVAWGH